MDVYLFGLLDENMKSTLPGNFERHWGLFRYDGQPKFPLDLSLSSHPKLPIAAEGVEYLPAQWCILNPESSPDSDRISADLNYACNRADCTQIEAGGSCESLDRSKYVSYAFNVFFQMQDQDVRACDFGGQAKIVTVNASEPGCLFPVLIVSGGGRVMAGFLAAMAAVVGVMMVLV